MKLCLSFAIVEEKLIWQLLREVLKIFNKKIPLQVLFNKKLSPFWLNFFLKISLHLISQTFIVFYEW